MKISNSKKQLAKIISENGGWRDGAEWSSQGGARGEIGFCKREPVPFGLSWRTDLDSLVGIAYPDVIIPNWHQTILSRDEYFHLYPAPDAVIVENKTTCHLIVTDKPTIEQLAAEYRNRKDYAERKQQEADAAKAGAEAKLAELVAAGKAVGAAVSVAAPEPELAITDVDDLIEGDVIELTAGKRYNKTECTMVHIPGVGLRAKSADDTEWRWWNLEGPQKSEWRFIRRPAKGDAKGDTHA